MLDAEYNELVSLLSDKRDIASCYFAFANTVATLNFTKDNYSHSWMGMRFQYNPGTDPNEVIFHVNLNDLRVQGILQTCQLFFPVCL